MSSASASDEPREVEDIQQPLRRSARLTYRTDRLGAVETVAVKRTKRVPSRPAETPSTSSSGEEDEDEDAEGSQEFRSVQSGIHKQTKRNSNKSKSVASNVSRTSTAERRRQQAELEAMKQLLSVEEEEDTLEIQRMQLEMDNAAKKLKLEMEKTAKRLQRKKEIVQKTLEVEKAKIAEENEESNHSQSIDDEDEENSVQSLPKSDKGKKKDAVANWVDSQPAVPEPEKKMTEKEEPASAIDKMTSLMEMMVQLQVKNSTGGDMQQFVTRQTVGKDLPVYGGEAEEWPAFFEEYKSTTEMCKFSDVENLRRLRKCLRGKAKDAVQSMLTVPENVSKVMEALEMNFGQPRLIIQALVNKVRSLPPLRDDKPQQTIDFANAVRNLVATMTSFGNTGHMNNPQLLDELVGKLPATKKENWAEKVIQNQSNVDLSHFSLWLDEKAKAANVFRNLTLEKEPRREERNVKPQRREGVFSTAEKSEDSDSQCMFCKRKHHALTDCRIFARKDMKSKLDFVRDKGLCFRCLNRGHLSSNCGHSGKCGKDGCEQKHHRLLHFPIDPPSVKSSDAQSEAVNNSSEIKSDTVLLCVLPVTLSGPGGKMKTFAMLDTASTLTMVSEEVANKLKLTGPKSDLSLNWVDSTNQVNKDVMSVSLGISGENRKEYRLQNVKVKPNLNLRTQSMDVKMLKKKYRHLRDVEIPDQVNAKPQILIGKNYEEFLQVYRTLAGGKSQPVAEKTKLGWVISGNDSYCRGNSNSEYAMYLSQNQRSDDALHLLVKDFFKTETFGVNMNAAKPHSKEDIRAREIMDTTTKRISHQWETGLLWRSDNPQLPNSKNMAEQRLRSIEKRMDRDLAFADQYCAKMLDYEKKGYCRKLSKEEASKTTSKMWYLPHFGVTNVNKPGKLRLVFDAAAKSHGVSLNDELLTGPDMLCSLQGVLLKFRERKIAFSGDIAEMFLQVGIREEDRQAQRFMWRGKERQQPPEVWEMKVMTFGAACSPTLAQEIKNRNAEEFREKYPKAVDAIIHQHYVDDYLDSAHSEDDAVKLIREVTRVHKKGGFTITGWISNSQSVLDKVTGNSACGKCLNFDSEYKVERVLGLQWKPQQDVFEFSCNFARINPTIVTGEKIPTKREMLQLVMSMFDPLGFLCPFVVRAKILLQDVWRAGIQWDEAITEELFAKWKFWIEDLQEIRKVRIPRCYSLEIQFATKIQLHIFCDASEQAFAAVGYLRMEIGENVDVKMTVAKSGVAPLKVITIPRMELQAAVMATRLATMLNAEQRLKIESTVFWSDSRVVLGWIKSDARKYKPFVCHRIGEIIEASDVNDWRWVPTEENVADEATRDNSSNDLTEESRWFNGPKFLLLTEDEWPTENSRRKYLTSKKKSPPPGTSTTSTPNADLRVAVDTEGMEEEVSGFLEEHWISLDTILAEEDAEVERAMAAEEIPEPCFIGATSELSWLQEFLEKHSSWSRLIRVTAWILRYKKYRKVDMQSPQRGRKSLIPAECREAETLWIKHSQNISFYAEITNLQLGKAISKESRLHNLKLFLDAQGIMRLMGRTMASPELAFDTKQPIVLDPKNKYTRLLLQHYHEEARHHGQEMVVNNLKQRFYILNVRTAVKTVWNHCQQCKLNRATPYTPEMAALPGYRVTRPERAFAVTGVDYFGPLTITIGRRHEKRYCALFTCLATRAVHLELVDSLTTDSAINAIRRFIGRRGNPCRMFSDNGTNFRGADVELRRAIKEIDEKKLLEELTPRGIDWSFIPPSSPHMGGSWERLVRSVKTALKVTLKERAPKEETLRTLLVEAESIVNGRPLTHVSDDPDDNVSLTPYCFLIGTPTIAPPPGDFSNDAFSLRKQWRMSQRLADLFWQRWVKEYLPSLTKRQKWHNETKPIKIGDLVLIADGNLERGSWPRGKITAVFPGKDGVIRVADVRTSTGTYRRPTCKLCVLDVAAEVDKSGSFATGGSMYPGSADNVGKPAEVKNVSSKLPQNKNVKSEAKYLGPRTRSRSVLTQQPLKNDGIKRKSGRKKTLVK